MKMNLMKGTHEILVVKPFFQLLLKIYQYYF
jgi:hypothetical protein